ncbi:hypothetical protein PP_13 [Cyanophage PP]|uniref:Uncharacterized protein n=1 Tax=Cyanophage PP TaxID=434346 RepID=U5PRD8_9CAUD|nr:hypothetical protein V420_gp13 [Cyanophage PP]AGY46480.1 hypothetical protein PP_13 [Cyanophage PP]
MEPATFSMITIDYASGSLVQQWVSKEVVEETVKLLREKPYMVESQSDDKQTTVFFNPRTNRSVSFISP